MKKYRLLFILGVFVLFLILLIPFYVWNFKESGIASDPQAWGVLGDYFGGILNPIISLASLFILGCLTYLVAKQTNKESKNIFILERRMLADDELAKYVKSINAFTPRMESAMSLMPVYEKLPAEQALPYTIKVLEELKELSTTYREFHFTLFEFNPRYGHLFKYDFNSQEYKDLLAESKRVSQLMAKLVTDHKNISEVERTEFTIPVKFAEMVFAVFVKLRSEVETDLD